MSSRRFIVNSRSIRNGYASYDGNLFNHIVRVLRLSQGDSVVLVDENGYEHSGVIDQLSREWVTIRIAQSSIVHSEERTHITVCQALPKGEKIDLILQKGTELGASDFWLFGGRRSIAQVRDDQLENKLERWKRITAEAARQCGRRSVPAITWFHSAEEACEAAFHDMRLILWESEREQRLKELFAGKPVPGSIIVAIGPEGGFETVEAQHFVQHGFKSVSLGSRILRTETATIAIMSILQYIFNEI